MKQFTKLSNTHRFSLAKNYLDLIMVFTYSHRCSILEERHF